MDQTTPTFEEVQEALAGRVIALAVFCEETMSMEPSRFLGFQPAEWPLPPHLLDLNTFPMARGLRPLYEYAYHATLGAEYSDPDALDDESAELLRDFADMVTDRNGRIEEILDAGTAWSSDRVSWTLIEDLIDRYYARSYLDGGLDLTVEQIALLAEMSERSVRNAMSLEGTAGLTSKRTSSPEGEKTTVIENAEARRWLSGRRGFRPTKRAWVPESAENLPAKIETIAELSAFIHQRVEAFYGDADAAAIATNLDKDWVNEALRLSALDLRDSSIAKLARLTNVEEDWLAEQLFRTLLPKNFARLAIRLGSKEGQQ